MNITQFLTKWDSKYVDGKITEVEVPEKAVKSLKADLKSLPAEAKRFVDKYVLSDHVRKLAKTPTPNP